MQREIKQHYTEDDCDSKSVSENDRKIRVLNEREKQPLHLNSKRQSKNSATEMLIMASEVFGHL